MSKRRIILLAFLAGVTAPVQANVLSGPATVIDGDTIDMTGTRIRIIGIDAPESAQQCTRAGQPWACGTEATATLHALVGGAPLQCTALGNDVYGRTLATCRTAVFDLGREMVRRGMALPSDDAPPEYAAAQEIARSRSYGLWAGEFQAPSAWRAANPRVAPQPDRTRSVARSAPSAAAPTRRVADARGCAIKGNHSRYGDLIYHLPGQRYYNATRAEAIFCTESEAIAAGFRRSKQ